MLAATEPFWASDPYRQYNGKWQDFDHPQRTQIR